MATHKPVLIIDDDEATREMFKFVIEQAGCEVETAANGIEAMEILRRPVKPCVILLDLMMPLMNGFELDHALAHDESLSSIPAIVITAFPERKSQLERHLQVVQKPVDVEEIVALAIKYYQDGSKAPNETR